MIYVKFTKVRQSEIDVTPTCSYENAAGWDVKADIPGESLTLAPHTTQMIPTGIAVELPETHYIQIWGRSGLAVKQALDRHAGIVDSDYRGEINVILHNHSDSPCVIKKGDRIGQLVICQKVTARFSSSNQLSETLRGQGGFGSSGA